MEISVRPRLVVSRCLGFDRCRYNGEIVNDSFVKMLEGHVEFQTVCPEVEIGLGVPRQPIRLESSRGEIRLRQPATGRDITPEMLSFCDGFLDSLGEVDGFILKYRSPSCGIKDVKVYPENGRSGAVAKGPGFFGGAVRTRFPYLAVEDEGRLRNFRIREHFLTRLFARARFRAVRADGRMRELVRLHTENKLLLMSYNQRELKEMGRIVANPERRKVEELISDYGEHLAAALAKAPRYTSNINVLMHSMGYFSNELTAAEKSYFLETLERYRKGSLPLSAVIQIVRSWIIRFGEDYLDAQVFFQPYPEELMIITDSGKGRDL